MPVVFLSPLFRFSQTHHMCVNFFLAQCYPSFISLQNIRKDKNLLQRDTVYYFLEVLCILISITFEENNLPYLLPDPDDVLSASVYNSLT